VLGTVDVVPVSSLTPLLPLSSINNHLQMRVPSIILSSVSSDFTESSDLPSFATDKGSTDSEHNFRIAETSAKRASKRVRWRENRI
jgi:hypothetical protein